MHLTINDRIFNIFPNLNLGVLVVKNANNHGHPRELNELLGQAQQAVRQQFTQENYKEHPKIAVWLEAHRKFGSKPKDYYPFIYALVKRVVKGNDLPSINTLVDLYNYVSLKFLVPVGGEDLDSVVGDIILTLADGNEEFIEIGGREMRPPAIGEVIYKDKQGVLCRRFNWREAERTKLTGNTKNAVLVTEGLLPTTTQDAEKVLGELENLVKVYTGAATTKAILNSEHKTLTLL